VWWFKSPSTALKRHVFHMVSGGAGSLGTAPSLRGGDHGDEPINGATLRLRNVYGGFM